MSDPMARVRGNDPPDLFSMLPTIAPTSRQEGQCAAEKSSSKRYQQISNILRDRGPLAGWQIAQALSCPLHSVSGRLTEMRDHKLIENTGQRCKNPASGVSGEVVRLRRQDL